jgi:allophanate hydrolase
LGGSAVEIDLAPFLEAQRLLYEGPWLAEREAAFGAFVAEHPRAVHPVVREVLAPAARMTATDVFRALYRLAELRRRSERELGSAPVLLLPTTPGIYRIAEVEADPIALNARLGLYTNFVNLLGLCAVTVPAGFRSDGLPFGVCLIALPGNEALLAALGTRLHAALGVGAGRRKRVEPAAFDAPATAGRAVRVAVVGAHLSGLPLNAQLTARGARLAERTRTAPCYRLYALAADGPVQRPGLVRAAPGEAGGSIEAEVWEMPLERFGAFAAEVPAPLGIGTVELAGGERVKGFLCEHYAVRHADDITAWGGWRRWLARGAKRNPH